MSKKSNKNLKLSILLNASNNISINNNNTNFNTISNTTKTSFNKSYSKRNNFNHTQQKSIDRTQILSLIKSIENEDYENNNKILIINGKKLLKKKSIFHVLPQKDKKFHLKSNFLLENNKKINEILPYLTKHSTVNNYLIRDLGNEKNSSDFIEKSYKKEKINEQFYLLREKEIQKKTEKILKRFNDYKNLNYLDAAFLNSDNNNNKSDNSNKKNKFSKIKKKRSISENYEKSERIYEKIKKEKYKNLKKLFQEKGKILSKKLTNLNNNDYVEINSSDSEENNNNNNKNNENENDFVVKKSVLYKNNLYHSINLMKILKENKNLINTNNNSDESNNSIIEYKKEKDLIELSMAKILKDEKPKFLKVKMNIKTNKKFNGISGKYFGC